VHEQLHELPVTLGGEPGDHADQHRDADADQPQPSHDGRAVARQRIVHAGDRHEHRPAPVGDHHVQRQRTADQRADGEEQHDPGDHHRAEHRSVPDLAEPEPLDVRVDDTTAGDQQDQHEQTDDEQDAAASRQLRQSGRRPSGHWDTLLSQVRRTGLHRE
jgi:hypothetical protein